MLRCIINLYDRCHKAVTESDSKVTWNTIKATMGPLIHQVTTLSFIVRGCLRCCVFNVERRAGRVAVMELVLVLRGRCASSLGRC